MNQNEKLTVEKLLEQMSLQQPSQELDDAILEMTRRQRPSEVELTPTARFSLWSLAATAIVCASLGILIGRWLPKGHMIDSVDSKSHLSATGDVPKTSRSQPAAQPSLVSLRENATAPLHGHEVQFIDEGFVLLDGNRPSHTFRVLKSHGRQRAHSLPVRETIVLPSPEI